MMKTVLALAIALLLAGAFVFLYVARSNVDSADRTAGPAAEVNRSGDRELAYLLVKLEKRTRKVMAGHLGREQEGGPDATAAYQGHLIRNSILPAAVADPIFSEVVPEATGGRAWVRMVVPTPRNPNNRGDATALEMLAELQEGTDSAWRAADGAHYYAEPITATAGCLPCHGLPAGAPDPHFSQYEKDGWEAGDVVGAVVARVAPAG